MNNVILCPGEYNSVYSFSMNKERMVRAHQTPCDFELALTLVTLMHCEFNSQYVSHPEIPPKVYFRRDKRGYKRSWARINLKTGRKIICLPHEKLMLTPEHVNPAGKLRVGVVVHEFCHLLTWRKSDAHGRLFTITFDELLYKTEQYWSHLTPNTMSKAAGR